MTKLDLVLTRIKGLTPEQQDAIAVEIAFMLDHDFGESPLTPEQEAELGRRLADPEKQYLSHDDVAAFLETKYGR